jgi:hypothetical protein
MVPASAAISATLRQDWTAVLTMSRPRCFFVAALNVPRSRRELVGPPRTKGSDAPRCLLILKRPTLIG